ncbi:hypothetical protein RCO27_14675 [Sphingosinicella sp. LHD-64]|uniref:hypothetical protein n=1 Tax=Sphingosinicella sp. LHD-64 TaxID=3072139 RepID=UPI00280E5F3D|nr:hypothetical protein [Sphingosinicella sp. LHD-64]MDQ8757473.1 hypothetical protein [Sphingosinicella sp. LHD-64]
MIVPNRLQAAMDRMVVIRDQWRIQVDLLSDEDVALRNDANGEVTGYFLDYARRQLAGIEDVIATGRTKYGLIVPD